MENNGGGVGEVRRVNLVYFLSRSGHVDHPHLLRVHHLSRNGVFLRDVKRWLADARGDAMPNAFCWSCKRRYKNGYVWQDLLDDDLITPISDNEYVLKGSEILRRSPKEEKKSCAARNVDDDGINAKEKLQKPKLTSEMMINHKEYPIFCSQRSSATTSTVTEEEEEEEETIVRNKKQIGNKKVSGEKENGSSGNDDTESGRTSVSSTTSSSSYVKSKSYSSNVLRNLMKCGGLDTNDAVLVPLNKSTSRAFGVAWEDNERRYQYQQHNARKSFEGAWSGIKMKETIEFCKPKVASSKPCLAPLCSQCGKLFKPEKMHSHMKLCRGRKNPSASNDATMGTNSVKPKQQRCRNIQGNSLGHKGVVRTTLKE